MLIQFFCGFVCSRTRAAEPEPETSVERNDPPAKSVSVVHVWDAADAGPDPRRNSPADESNTIASTTEKRLIVQVPLRAKLLLPQNPRPERTIL